MNGMENTKLNKLLLLLIKQWQTTERC